MTDVDIEARDRVVAAFVAEIWMAEYKRAGRIHPTLTQAIVAAYQQAQDFVDAYVGNRMGYLGAPRAARNRLYARYGADIRPSAKLADQAEAALAYLKSVGDNPRSKPASIEVDRRVFEHVLQGLGDSEIGRKLGLSHTQVGERRKDRAQRIGHHLRQIAPDIWADTLKPHAVKLGARIVKPSAELQIAA